jgi:hypothetical protein
MGLHETFTAGSQSILVYKTIIFFALKILYWATKSFSRCLLQNYETSLSFFLHTIQNYDACVIIFCSVIIF